MELKYARVRIIVGASTTAVVRLSLQELFVDSC